MELDPEPPGQSDDATPSHPQPEQQHQPRQRQRIVSGLIVLASLVAVLAAVNTWLERQLLDTDEWVEASDDLLADDEVRYALAAYLVDQIYESIDVGEELGQQLPDDLAPLGDLVAGALREPATDGVDRLLESDAVADVWVTVNRDAHATLVALLKEEDVIAFSTTGGEFALDLGDLVREVALDLGVSEERLDELPDDVGRIVIVESDELDAAQNVVRVVEVLSVVFFLAVIGLYAAAVFLAGSRRREAVRNIGFALIISGLILLVARRIATRAAAAAVGDAPDGQGAARVVAAIATELLQQMAIAGIVYGLVVVGFAVLAGPSAPAVWLRTMLAPLLIGRPLVTWVSAAVLFLVVLAIAPGEPFEQWWRGLIFVLLFAAAVTYLRRQLRDEFPDPSVVDVSATLKGGPSGLRPAD